MVDLNETECKILIEALDLKVKAEQDTIDYSKIYDKLMVVKTKEEL